MLDAMRSLQPQDKILITGSERGVISFANCCLPIPGDDIMGYHTTGRGIVVHRLECPNVADYRKSPERWVQIGWDRQVSGDYQAALRIEVDNRPGVLAQVAAAVAKAESNIDRVEYIDKRREHFRAALRDRGRRPQAPGRRDPARAPTRRGARRAAHVERLACRGAPRTAPRVPLRFTLRLFRSLTPCPANRSTPTRAPAAIGPYSQAVRRGGTVYLSGQIPLDPNSGLLIEGDIDAQARRAFDNLKAVCEAAGGSLDDVVRLGLYLTDLGQFAAVNAVMADYFDAPYPARSTIGVASLPRGARVRGRRDHGPRLIGGTRRQTRDPRSPRLAPRHWPRCRAWVRALPRNSPRAAC